QSRLLGEFWASRRLVFDRVFSGPLVRQIRSAEITGESYAASGHGFPQPEIIPELQEYNADAIMAGFLPLLSERHAHVRELAAAYERSGNGAERYKSFQKVFEVVMGSWLEGALEPPGVESWREYRDRVRQAIARVTAGRSGGRKVAAFTSGGPISVA